MRPDSMETVDDSDRVTETPSIGRVVVYRNRSGDYDVPAIITATQDTLYRPNVDSGHVPGITAPMRVHLRVFTPGEDGAYAEHNVPYGGECWAADDLARTWRWPRSDAPPFAREPEPESRFAVGDRVVATGWIPSTPYHVDRAPGTVTKRSVQTLRYCVEFDAPPEESHFGSWWLYEDQLEPEPERVPLPGERVFFNGDVTGRDEPELRGLKDCAAIVVTETEHGWLGVRLVDERVPERLQALDRKWSALEGVYASDYWVVSIDQIEPLVGDTDEIRWKARAAKYCCYPDPAGEPEVFHEVPRDAASFADAKIVVRRDTGEIVKWSTR